MDSPEQTAARMTKAEAKRSIRRAIAYSLDEPPDTLILDDGSHVDIENFTEEDARTLSAVAHETINRCYALLWPKEKNHDQ